MARQLFGFYPTDLLPVDEQLAQELRARGFDEESLELALAGEMLYSPSRGTLWSRPIQ